MKRHLVVVLLSFALLASTAGFAVAGYQGCVVNLGHSVVQGSLVDSFDKDSFGFIAQPGETVCFPVMQEGDYRAVTDDGRELGTLSVDADQPFEYEGKQVYWMVNVE